MTNGGWYEPHSVLRLMPTSFQVRAFLVVGRASLRLKTASAAGAIDCFLRLANASSRHRSCVTVSGALSAPTRTNYLWRLCCTPLSTRHLRLLFRLVRTGICTPSSIRREPPFASIRPPIRGLMNAQNFACGTRFHLSPRAGMQTARFSTPPGTMSRNGFLPLIPFSVPRPQS